MLRESPAAIEVEVKDRTDAKMCEPQPFYRASSTLLSRLAEAVDGNRKGKAVVFVAEYWYHPKEKGHEVHGPFETCKEAAKFREDELKDEKGMKYGIFGPFWTRWSPSGSTSSRKGSPVVEKVVVHLTGGQTIDLDPKDVDAVFWSPAAVEKFVIPYYVGIGTVQEGVTILDALNSGVVLVHRPGSEWKFEQPDILINGKPLEKDPGIGTVVIELKERKSQDPLVIASPLV